ncbi:hypothetical protein [Streptomyces globisporus]|uniref:hypothetical protein n=1 Tax=Streptomyces globisporus TaxID=1908 RepID=UPI0037CC9E37
MANKKSPAHFAKQAQEVYELSLAGYSQRQIAEKMGIALLTVQKRLALYIEERVHPKADEWRNQQLARAQIYIRSLWSQVLAGDPKAIAAAVRTEERIAKLLGLDSATQFKMEVQDMSRESDANEVQGMLDRYFSRDSAEPKTIAGEVVTNNGYTRPRRPLQKPKPVQYAKTEPADEFARDADATELEPEDLISEDVEEFPIRRRRRGQPIPNPAAQFLVDEDD